MLKMFFHETFFRTQILLFCIQYNVFLTLFMTSSLTHDLFRYVTSNFQIFIDFSRIFLYGYLLQFHFGKRLCFLWFLFFFKIEIYGSIFYDRDYDLFWWEFHVHLKMLYLLLLFGEYSIAVVWGVFYDYHLDPLVDAVI